jgi:uncharacterized phage-associated protein
MAVHIKHFDREKALEIIIFIAGNLQYPTLHSISKMLYLSDKLHLQEYGRLICGDSYLALEYGPVPSAIYNMMKVADDKFSIDADWDELIKEAISVSYGRNIIPKRNYDADLLSESETECILQTITDYGFKTFGQLTDITHDSAWMSVHQSNYISIEAIVATLPNSQDILNYIHAN